MIEEELQAWFGDPFQPPDQLHQSDDEPLLLAPCELSLAPALREPYLIASGDQLDRQERRDDLEDVGHPAGGGRQGRDAEEDHEKDGEALLFEQLDEAPSGLLPFAREPAFECFT